MGQFGMYADGKYDSPLSHNKNNLRPYQHSKELPEEDVTQLP